MNFKKIFQQKVDFYNLLIRQCDYTLKGGRLLHRYFELGDDADAVNVKQMEKSADEERKQLVSALDQTFITPFEREDIFSLSKAIDDILDYFTSTAKEMQVYELKSTPELKDMVAVLQEATENIYQAVCNLGKDKVLAAQFALKAKKAENKVESLYRHNVAALFQNDDLKYILKMREIYRHLSNCADVIDASADVIENITVKMV